MRLAHLTESLLILVTAITRCAQAVSLPTCQSIAPQQTTLNSVKTAYLSVPHAPFGLAYASRQKNIAFVSLAARSNSTLGVLNTTTFPPSLIHQIALPTQYTSDEGALGLALTHDGKHVLIAAGAGIVIVDAQRAATGNSSAVVGVLNGTTSTQKTGDAAIEVTIGPYDKYAYVSQEYGIAIKEGGSGTGNIDVFHIDKAAQNGSVTGAPIGHLNLGYAVVGSALSPDGKTLYALSELATANNSTQGILTVIDTDQLHKNPSEALRGNVTAGCGPVRVIVSSNGKHVWVTARESNHLLGFDAEKLVSNPSAALLTSVQVGTAPVGLTFAKQETRIITADSNRFDLSNATTGLSVVDVEAALNGSADAVLGTVPTGKFPREFAVSPDGNNILVADFASDQVQIVDVESLP